MGKGKEGGQGGRKKGREGEGVSGDPSAAAGVCGTKWRGYAVDQGRIKCFNLGVGNTGIASVLGGGREAKEGGNGGGGRERKR